MSVLLRQPQVFEGVLPVLVHGAPLHCSVADCPHKGDTNNHLDSIASDHVARPRHYHVITHLDELVRLDPKGLPVPGEFLPSTPGLIKSVNAVHQTESPRHVQLEARSRVLERGVPVLAVDCVDIGLDDLHVLVRNNRSPHLHGRRFERNALPQALELTD